MHRALLHTLFGLYAAFGTAFAAWALIGRNAAAGDTFALPLPEWTMWLAAAVNLAIAVGGFARIAAVRHVALAAHAVVACTAATVLVDHLLDTSGAYGAGAHAEMLAKGGVHAALFVLWLRSRALRAHLRRR